jgi:hypothetical protein
MDKKISALIRESTQLELNVAELYLVFYRFFPDDADFWWKLVIEEEAHAALFRSIEESFVPAGVLPDELLSSPLDSIQKTNAEIVALIAGFKSAPPSREEAFNIAYKLEESAGEIHFQKFMTKNTESTIGGIFQRLNGDDKDHADRIRSYMERHGIKRL